MADVPYQSGGDMANIFSVLQDVPTKNANNRLTNQQANLAAQQAQQAEMQNQITKATIPLITKSLSDYSDGNSEASPGASDESGVASGEGAAPKMKPISNASGVEQGDDPSASPESSWYKPEQIDAALRKQFFVQPYTQQEAGLIKRAALLKGQMPGLLESATQARTMRVEQQTAQSQNNANNLYEAIHTVVDAAPGNALAQLSAIAPDAAKRIQKMIPDAADEDASARAYAAHVGGTVHQYTGRKSVARGDGVYVDEVTGRPVLGVEKSGMSMEQWTNLAKAGNVLVPMNDGQGHTIQVPQHQANGFKSLNDWVMQQAAFGGEWGAQPTVGGAPKAKAQAGAAAGIVAAKKAQADGLPGTPVAGTTTTDGKPDPQASALLSDHSFDFKPPSHGFGVSLSPDEQAIKDAQVHASVALKQENDAAIPHVQQSLTFYRAAKDILDSQGATSGKWNTLVARAAAWVPGIEVPKTTNYQELSKYLLNAALQAGKGTFAKMTEREADSVMHDLNPSANMNETALRHLIDNGVKMSEYSLKGASLVGAYLKSGKDATQFYTALNKHIPEPEFVVPGKNAPHPSPPADQPPAQKYSDAQITKWAQKHDWPVDKARQFLLGGKK